MGWLFTHGQARSDLIKRRIEPQDGETHKYTCLRHAARGNVLWSVWEREDKTSGEKRRYIACDLMQNHKGYGWGYKDMDESMHPYYYSCPLSFLAMVPTACEEWRQGVRAYHRQLKIGETVQLKYTLVPSVRIVSTRPLRGEYNGTTYRLSRNQLVNLSINT